jgi:hypothetical protein
MYAQSLPAGKHTVSVNAWSPKDAKEFGVPNWSLRSLQSNEDVFKQSALVRGLRTIFEKAGVQEACAPNVASASAAIIQDYRLTSRIRLGSSMYLFRNKSLPADGLFLDPGMALVMSLAGCPFIIAESGQHLIVAHAGRDSLVDRGAVIGSPMRKHISVVLAIINAFEKRGVSTDRLTMSMHFAIPTLVFMHRFDHYEFGEYNQSLFKFIVGRWPGCAHKNGTGMFLDLEALFVSQALEVGIRHAWALNSLAQYPDLAHTRDGQDPQRRNLFVIKRDPVHIASGVSPAPQVA